MLSSRAAARYNSARRVRTVGRRRGRGGFVGRGRWRGGQAARYTPGGGGRRGGGGGGGGGFVGGGGWGGGQGGGGGVPGKIRLPGRSDTSHRSARPTPRCRRAAVDPASPKNVFKR